MTKSAAQYQKEYRERLKHNGLFGRHDFYVHPDDVEEMREIEQELREIRIREKINQLKSAKILKR